jgi:predicted nucleotidyltransferase
MAGPLIFLNKKPLAGLTPERFIEKLKLQLRDRVESCYIFGSFNTPKFTSDSDVDIILVHDTKVPFLDRGKDFLDLYEIGPRIDLLIYTPGEFKILLEEDTGFWKSVKENLVKIF